MAPSPLLPLRYPPKLAQGGVALAPGKAYRSHEYLTSCGRFSISRHRWLYRRYAYYWTVDVNSLAVLQGCGDQASVNAWSAWLASRQMHSRFGTRQGALRNLQLQLAAEGLLHAPTPSVC